MRRGSVKITDIQRAVAAYYELDVRQILSKNLRQDIVFARHVAMFLAREMTHNSFPAIAARFKRDNSATFHGVRRIARLVDEDPTIAADIANIKETLTTERKDVKND